MGHNARIQRYPKKRYKQPGVKRDLETLEEMEPAQKELAPEKKRSFQNTGTGVGRPKQTVKKERHRV